MEQFKISVLKGWFRLPISMTDFGHRYDFKHLKSVTFPISGDRNFSIEIGKVADLTKRGIVNTNTSHIAFVFI